MELITSFDTVHSSTVFDACINLAGAPIAAWPWTRSRRKILLHSRTHTTRALISLIGRLQTKPTVMISASAAGYYGHCSDGEVTESSPAQPVFMSQLCAEWEAEAHKVSDYGVRLVIPRISVVLGRDGGAFPQLKRPIQMYAGSIMGAGTQYFPWIHKDDALRFFDFALTQENLTGPVNMVAPDAVTQEQFTRTLADSMGRPCPFRIPAGLLRTTMGELSDLMLAGQHLSAGKLQDAGFAFRHASLQSALAALLSES